MGGNDDYPVWDVRPVMVLEGTDRSFKAVRSGSLDLRLVTTDLTGQTIPVRGLAGNQETNVTVPEGAFVILQVGPGVSGRYVVAIVENFEGDRKTISDSDFEDILKDRSSILRIGKISNEALFKIVSGYDLSKYNLPPYRVDEFNLIPVDVRSDTEDHFGPDLMEKLKEELSAALYDIAYKKGIDVEIFSEDLFPIVGGGLAADFSHLPDTIKVSGISAHSFNNQFGCRWKAQKESGGQNALGDYADVGSVFLGVHEATHVLDLLTDPERNNYRLADGKLIEADGGYDVRTNEVLSDATAAIFLLNRYPDNPRIVEFIDRFSDRRVASSDARPDHETSGTLRRILKNSALWENDGKPLSIEKARELAVEFLKSNPELTADVSHSREHVEKARNQFCSKP